MNHRWMGNIYIYIYTSGLECPVKSRESSSEWLRMLYLDFLSLNKFLKSLPYEILQN